MSDATLPSGWQAIQGLQHYLENNKWLDASTLAAEEALTDALDAFLSGEPVSDTEIHRSFHSRRLNRRRRNRQRDALLANHADTAVRPELARSVSDASTVAEAHDFIQTLELKIDASGITLLKRLAAGIGYSQMAAELGVSLAALRTQACRTREFARTLAA